MELHWQNLDMILLKKSLRIQLRINLQTRESVKKGISQLGILTSYYIIHLWNCDVSKTNSLVGNANNHGYNNRFNR